ncbi:MAG: hypothetical protein UFG06_13995 [Lachnospiraceae bacterium]|nr:hypothetical protein [Lachnospiraceae bacterium]
MADMDKNGTGGNSTGYNINPNSLKNLVPFQDMTLEERQNIGSKGGKASVEAKKRKRDLREIAKALLAADMSDTQVAEILGTAQDLLDGDKSVGAVLTARMAQEAGKGNYKAYEVLRDTAGYKPKDQLEVDAVITDADRALLDKVAARLDTQNGLHNSDKQQC